VSPACHTLPASTSASTSHHGPDPDMDPILTRSLQLLGAGLALLLFGHLLNL